MVKTTRHELPPNATRRLRNAIKKRKSKPANTSTNAVRTHVFAQLPSPTKRRARTLANDKRSKRCQVGRRCQPREVATIALPSGVRHFIQMGATRGCAAKDGRDNTSKQQLPQQTERYGVRWLRRECPPNESLLCRRANSVIRPVACLSHLWRNRYMCGVTVVRLAPYASSPHQCQWQSGLARGAGGGGAGRGQEGDRGAQLCKANTSAVAAWGHDPRRCPNYEHDPEHLHILRAVVHHASGAVANQMSCSGLSPLTWTDHRTRAALATRSAPIRFDSPQRVAVKERHRRCAPKRMGSR